MSWVSRFVSLLLGWASFFASIGIESTYASHEVIEGGDILLVAVDVNLQPFQTTNYRVDWFHSDGSFNRTLVNEADLGAPPYVVFFDNTGILYVATVSSIGYPVQRFDSRGNLLSTVVLSELAKII
jgi:hypothetical protein